MTKQRFYLPIDYAEYLERVAAEAGISEDMALQYMIVAHSRIHAPQAAIEKPEVPAPAPELPLPEPTDSIEEGEVKLTGDWADDKL